MKTSALLLLLLLLLPLPSPDASGGAAAPCFAAASGTGETALGTAEASLLETEELDLRETGEAQLGRETPIPDGATFLRLLAKMLVATAVAALLVVLLARFLNRARSLSALGHIRVLDRAALAANKTVWLVQVHGKLLVVGTAGESIAPLSEFTDPEQIRSILLEYNLGATGRSFEEQLRNLAGPPEPPEP